MRTGKEPIVDLLHAGDLRALEDLYEGYHGPLYYFIYQSLHDASVTNNILANCFQTFWSERSTFSSDKEIESWLFRFVYEAVLYNNSNADLEVIDSILAKSKFLRKVYESFDTWPNEQRQVFLMVYQEGMTMFGVAEALKLSVDSVRVLHAKGLQAIRNSAKK